MDWPILENDMHISTWYWIFPQSFIEIRSLVSKKYCTVQLERFANTISLNQIYLLKIMRFLNWTEDAIETNLTSLWFWFEPKQIIIKFNYMVLSHVCSCYSNQDLFLPISEDSISYYKFLNLWLLQHFFSK